MVISWMPDRKTNDIRNANTAQCLLKCFQIGDRLENLEAKYLNSNNVKVKHSLTERMRGGGKFSHGPFLQNLLVKN